MKEMYKSPELEILCLAPAERIASAGDGDFDWIKPESFTQGDTEIDIPLK